MVDLFDHVDAGRCIPTESEAKFLETTAIYYPSRLGLTLGEMRNTFLIFTDDFLTNCTETRHFIDSSFLEAIGVKQDLWSTKITRITGQCMDAEKVLGVLKIPLSLTIFRNKNIRDPQSRRVVELKNVVVVRSLPVQLHISWKKLDSEASRDDWLKTYGWHQKNLSRHFHVECVPLSYHIHPFWRNEGKVIFLPPIIEDTKRAAQTSAAAAAAAADDDDDDDDNLPGLTVFNSSSKFGPKSESAKEEQLRTDAAPESTSLQESDLNRWASAEGWSRTNGDIGTFMIAFIRNNERLNFWLTTGTVGSYLWHPKQPEKRRTQLFRREISPQEARDIFKNPRVHTGKGYSKSSTQYRGKRRREEDN